MMGFLARFLASDSIGGITLENALIILIIVICIAVLVGLVRH